MLVGSSLARLQCPIGGGGICARHSSSALRRKTMQAGIVAAVADAERVVKKQKTCSTRSLDSIAALLQEVQAAKKQLSKHGEPQSVLQELQRRIAAINTPVKLAEATKDLHSSIQKLSKSVDKPFVGDICQATRDLEMDPAVLNQVIAEHLFQEGKFTVGERFVEEAGVMNGEQLRQPFTEMHEVLERMKGHDLQPALRWAQEHRKELGATAQGCGLEFSLHRLHFLQVFKADGPKKALQYARLHLAPFQHQQLQEVQKLMACLVFVKRPRERNPYSHLLEPGQRDAVARDFARQCCGLLGLAQDSPLLVATAAGAAALPTLLKCAALMAMQGQDIRTCEQLPTDLELGSEFVFHSIFACPVSREQSSASNPPKILPCGHVLCHQSILKIAKSNTRAFKCPYCPQESTPNSCKELHFPAL